MEGSVGLKMQKENPSGASRMDKLYSSE